MNVGQLIKILSKLDPKLPIATHANNHSYFSDKNADGMTHGNLLVSLCHHYAKDHVIIGNQYCKGLNHPNWYITEDIHGVTREGR